MLVKVSALSHGSQLVAELGFFDVVTNFAYHIRFPQGLLHFNLLFSRNVQLGTFLWQLDSHTLSLWDKCTFYFVVEFSFTNVPDNFICNNMSMQKQRATKWVAEYTVKSTPLTKIMMRVLELSNAENFKPKVIWEMTNYNIKNSGKLDYDK